MSRRSRRDQQDLSEAVSKGIGNLVHGREKNVGYPSKC